MTKSLLNSKTFQNLVNAFAGESQASIRYRQLAEKTRDKGLNELAKFIEMISTNEYYHAKSIYKYIETATEDIITDAKVCSGYPFKERLECFEDAFALASTNENEEASEIYPAFSKTAKEEGYEDIAKLFDNIIQVENCHRMALDEIDKELKNDTMYNRTPAIKWKCSKCGYEATTEHAWKKCPICGAPQGDIMLELEQN